MNAPNLKPDYTASDIPDPTPVFRLQVVGPVILVAAGLLMASISWGKWMDILVDFDLQVYIPWQLSQGQVLYKDITYFHGPLSAYIHAVLFMLFGPGISVLAGFNIGLIVILAVTIHYLFRNLFDPLTGYLAALSFVVVFAFGNYLQVGNYNFVCAYEYTLTHGIFLSFIAIHQFAHYLRNPLPRTLFLIGLLFKYALEVIDQKLEPEDEFVAFPTGSMLNYMSRRRSPIPTTKLNPVELLMTGESTVLNSLKNNNPDFIILVDHDFAHLGAQFFGRDYAKATYKWIIQNYKVTQQIGARPFSNQGFGIQILKRKSIHLEQ